MANRLKVLILGYGEMGHALKYLLQKNVDLTIWERHPKNSLNAVALEDIIINKDVVFYCLPVNAHKSVSQSITKNISKNCICISIAKGLNEDGNTAAEIFSAIFESTQLKALLYGPMISEEIRAGRVAFAQLGCLESSIFQKINAIFNETNLHLQHSTDITGISWSVILKNVYALIFGIADELELGDNMRGFLAQASLAELNNIVQVMGGIDKTPYNLAGLGDLITTATSEDSHHHELGRMLARGETDNIKGEGIHTLNMVNKHMLFNVSDYPLFSLIQSIVQNPANVKERIQQYIDITFEVN